LRYFLSHLIQVHALYHGGTAVNTFKFLGEQFRKAAVYPQNRSKPSTYVILKYRDNQKKKKMTQPATPHKSGALTPNCGYESPSEESHPAFYHAENTAPAAQCISSVTLHGPPAAAAPVAGPSKRPAYASRPSFVVAQQDANQAQMSSAGSNPSSLDDMVEKAHNDATKKKVGVRDRIACYQWTYFTMVSTLFSAAR
jgi:hypothetical protein